MSTASRASARAFSPCTACQWKRESSRALKPWFRTQRPRYYVAAEMATQFWQPRYYPFEIYTEEKLHENVSYMHENPIESGLVTRPVDYHWSSARYRLTRLLDQPNRQPLDSLV